MLRTETQNLPCSRKNFLAVISICIKQFNIHYFQCEKSDYRKYPVLFDWIFFMIYFALSNIQILLHLFTLFLPELYEIIKWHQVTKKQSTVWLNELTDCTIKYLPFHNQLIPLKRYLNNSNLSFQLLDRTRQDQIHIQKVMLVYEIHNLFWILFFLFTALWHYWRDKMHIRTGWEEK